MTDLPYHPPDRTSAGFMDYLRDIVSGEPTGRQLLGSKRLPRLGRTVFIFFSSILAVYAAIFIVETMMEPNHAIKVDNLTITVPEGAPEITMTVDGYGYAVTKRGAVNATLSGNIADTLAQFDEPAILVPRARRAVRAQLGGETLPSIGPTARTDTYITLQPHAFEIPEAALRGDGELVMAMEARDAQPYVAAIYVGESDAILEAYRWRNWIGVILVIGASAISIVTAAIAFALSIRGTNRGAMISFGLMMICWAVIDLWYIGMFSHYHPMVGRFVYSLAIFLMAVASLAYLNEWTFKSPVVRKIVVPILAVSLFLLLLPMFFVDSQSWYYLILIADAIGLLCVILMIGQMFLYVSRDTDMSMLSAFIFLAAISVVVIDVISSIYRPLTDDLWPLTGVTIHYGPVMSIFLGLTIVGGFVRGFITTQRTLARANETLSIKLAEREAEIAQVYAAREAEMREIALIEERKRIMRDMHDGVGGKLLSLSLRAKGDNLDPQEMGQELDNSLQELRLIVDSMDTADGDLELALGALRGRLEPALYEAGIELDWDAGELGPQPGYGPQQVLSIYRMIQEAVTNTIRHAHATEIHFKSHVLDENWIELSIRDNGVGLSEDAIRDGSKGLKNLRSRAAELGGVIDFISDNTENTGLTVRIRLPNHLGRR